ncbi:hypothetical protein PS639_05884 [Pseudomonas fluorescens]|nr:hypothetical protein PS639_05884 [Pseudomonas fluorescens]
MPLIFTFRQKPRSLLLQNFRNRRLRNIVLLAKICLRIAIGEVQTKHLPFCRFWKRPFTFCWNQSGKTCRRTGHLALKLIDLRNLIKHRISLCRITSVSYKIIQG